MKPSLPERGIRLTPPSFREPRSLCALAVLCAAMAGIVGAEVDAASLYFDVLAPFRGHFAGMAVAGLLAMFVHRQAWLILAGGIVLSAATQTGISWSRQVTDLAGMKADPRGVEVAYGGRVRRIAFVNAWNKNPAPERLIAFLRTVPADVVVLAEIDAGWRPKLKAVADLYPYQRTCSGRDTCQITILSRLPFQASGSERQSMRQPPIVWVRFAPGILAEQQLTLVGTHLWRPTRNPLKHRFHLRSIGLFTRRLRGPVVVAGDFNAPDWSHGMRGLLRDANLAPSGCMLPSWPVWPLVIPQFAFDTFLATPDVSIARTGLGPAVGSDHLPVWAELAPRPGVSTRCGQ